MKVLLINNFHYRKGGSESVYFNTAELLCRAGHEVIFFSFADPEIEECAEQEYFAERRNGLLKSAADYFYNRNAARKLELLLQHKRPDIAHIHLIWGGMSPSILRVLKRHGIPVVHTAHDYRMVCPAYTFRTPDGKICERCKGRRFYRCALHSCSKGNRIQSVIMAAEMYMRNICFNPARMLDGVIFVSRFSQQKHFQYAPQLQNVESTVLCNMAPDTDTRFMNNGRRAYFLYAGRLSGEKGVGLLISAFASMPDMQLKIVGTGPDEEQLRQQAKGCSNITFEGYKNGDELRQIIADASFVIVPSQWYENNPMSIIEAYAHGVPVIGSNIGGIPEIVEEGVTGYLFETGNVRALCTAVRQAAQLDMQEYTTLSNGARNFASDKFERSNYAMRLTDFYSQCITKVKKNSNGR